MADAPLAGALAPALIRGQRRSSPMPLGDGAVVQEAARIERYRLKGARSTRFDDVCPLAVDDEDSPGPSRPLIGSSGRSQVTARTALRGDAAVVTYPRPAPPKPDGQTHTTDSAAIGTALEQFRSRAPLRQSSTTAVNANP